MQDLAVLSAHFSAAEQVVQTPAQRLAKRLSSIDAREGPVSCRSSKGLTGHPVVVRAMAGRVRLQSLSRVRL